MRADLIARVRADVAAGLDAGAMLSAYADPTRRRALHERVRLAARVDLTDAEVASIAAALFGFGVLQPLLDDPTITDVLVNSADEIFVERDGRLERTEVRFASSADVSELAHRIAAGVGRELTLERPFVDARMRDGSRANAVIAPVGGPSLSVRKFARLSLPLRGDRSWVSQGALRDEAAQLLTDAVVRRANLLIVGATGAGKSTFLRSLAAEIPADERLIVIEDTNELVLPHPHVVHLEAMGAGRDAGVGIADLVANALRMRPDRIIVGEVRTPREATALLDALTTGHDGSLTTAHAGSARGAIDRLELLLARAGESSSDAVRRHVLSAFDLIVHVARRGGTRSVTEIAAIEDGALRTVYRP